MLLAQIQHQCTSTAPSELPPPRNLVGQVSRIGPGQLTGTVFGKLRTDYAQISRVSTRRQYSAEEKVRNVIAGLRGEENRGLGNKVLLLVNERGGQFAR
jgi:hypothetical protein